MASTQTFSTEIRLEAVLDQSVKGVFNSTNQLLGDLTKQGTALERELKNLGKRADEVDQIGKSSADLRRDMTRLERQIDETRRAAAKFGNAKRYFREMKIGAGALKQEIGDIIGFAGKASIAMGAMGTAAAVGLAPPEELKDFETTWAGIQALSPNVDQAAFDNAKQQIVDLSNQFGISTAEIAHQQRQLVEDLGFEGSVEAIPIALEFQQATGVSITDIRDELDTAKISLGVDTAPELEQFLTLLKNLQSTGYNVENLDLGDLEGITKRVGTEDLSDQKLQRELLTSIVFKQFDSFQYADYAQAFPEEIMRATTITPETMNANEINKAQEALATLEKWGIRAEDGLLGAMEVFNSLSESQQADFVAQVEPILTSMPVEMIMRAAPRLDEVNRQVDAAMANQQTLTEASQKVQDSWSKTWDRIGQIGTNTAHILQRNFAEVFGPPLLEKAEQLFKFLSAHEAEIKDFFTGIRDEVSPVIDSVQEAVQAALPDVKQFATEVWAELRGYWNEIAPAAEWLANKIWSIAKSTVGFIKEHPKLVATLIAGIAAWKAYKIASGGVQVVYDFLAGGVSMLQGHYHKLNAAAIANQRTQQSLGQTALGTGQKFLKMGKNIIATKFPRFTTVIGGITRIGVSAIATLPGIGAMGAGLWAAITPLLPVILPVIAAIAVVAGLGYLIYKNWEPLKPFFTALWNFIKLSGIAVWEGIQTISLLSLKIIKDIWGGLKGFFKSVWGGIKGIFTNSPLAPIFKWIFDGVKAVVSPISKFFEDLWNGIAEKASEALGPIIKFVEGINDTLRGWITGLRGKNAELRAELNINQKSDSQKIPEPVKKGWIEPDKWIREKVSQDGIDKDLGWQRVSFQLLEGLRRQGVSEQEIESLLPSKSVLESVDNPWKEIAPSLYKALSEKTVDDPQIQEMLSNLKIALPDIAQKETGSQEMFDAFQGMHGVGITSLTTDTLEVNSKNTTIRTEGISVSPEITTQTQQVGVPEIETPENVMHYDVQDMQADRAYPGAPAVSGDAEPAVLQSPAAEPIILTQEAPAQNESSRTEVTQNITLNVYQQPGEDSADFADRVARIVREELKDAPNDFLTQ